MKNICASLLGLVLAITATILPERVAAACTTSDTKADAWGDYRIVRDTSCNCLFEMSQYQCVRTTTAAINATVKTSSVVYTLAASCDTACEDTPGYDAAVAYALSFHMVQPSGSGIGYECDSAFTDADGDGVGACLDADDTNPRITVKSSGSETICDDVDTNGDGVIDNGLTGCGAEPDQKRLSDPSLYQGDVSSRVNLIDGNLMRTEVDATIQGTYGPLSFVRTYNSRRPGNDANLGTGWTHSFAVYLSQMPSGDDRWRVQTMTGENQYFRCTAINSNTQTCVIDDHHPRGNLIRTGGAWYFYPGDGTRYEFDDTPHSGRRTWAHLLDGSGNTIADSTLDGSGQVTAVATANSGPNFVLVYSSGDLVTLQIDAASPKDVAQYTQNSVSGLKELVQVNYAQTLGTIDSDTLTAYAYYNPSSPRVLQYVKKQLTSGSPFNVAVFSYATSGANQVTSIVDASKNLSISYAAPVTTVTYNVDSSPSISESSDFTSNGFWIVARSTPARIGGMSAHSEERDDQGRITCSKSDDSVSNEYVYADTRFPIRKRMLGSGICGSSGPLRTITYGWGYNTTRQSWRRLYTREPSIYASESTDCNDGSLPSGCKEELLAYVGSTDDRISSITVTGKSRDLSGTIGSNETRVTQFYYYPSSGSATGCSATGNTAYAGLPCSQQLTDGSTIYTQTDFDYYSSSDALPSRGLLKAVSRYVVTGGKLTTSVSSYNAFGTATIYRDPANTETDYAFNG